MTVFLALTASPLSAVQHEDTLHLDPIHRTGLEAVKDRIEGTPRLRIVVDQGQEIVLLPRLVDERLVYRAPHPSTLPGSVSADAYLQVAVEGTASKTGALIGGVAGGVIGATLAAFAAGFACIDAERPCAPPFVLAGLYGAAVGGGGGALFGLVVGSFIAKWQPVYEHRP